MRSIAGTPMDSDLPAKKRGGGGNTVEMMVDFMDKKLNDPALVWLIKNIRSRPQFLMCNHHRAGDDFAAELPFWFDGMVSFNGEPPEKGVYFVLVDKSLLSYSKNVVQFVKEPKSHLDAVTRSGKSFYGPGSKHVFWKFIFEQHVTGFAFRCTVERDLDWNEEEESKDTERPKKKASSKKKRVKVEKSKEESNSSSKKKKTRVAKPVSSKQKSKNARTNSKRAAAAAAPPRPVQPEEAGRIIAELEETVRVLCADARNRINGIMETI
jgi:outer membrane biosynthesis protein TonB